jgi:hypothetical protein
MQQHVDIDQIVERKKERDEDSILRIGTNGIPILLDILGATDKNVKKVVSKLQNKELQQEYGHKEAHVEDLRCLAVDGFALLGTNAESAIPRMSNLLNDDETRFQAARALTKVGPKGFAVLTNAIARGNGAVRNNLIWSIGEEGGADKKVITQLLIDSLKDADWTTRGNAAEFLASKDPTIAIPALILMLDDKEYYPRERAAIALGSYGPAAISAAPKLLSVYTNVIAGSDKQLAKDLGYVLLDALEKIDRKAAGQAEAFLVNSGPLHGARLGYTRTLLPNGKELIAGGYVHTEIPTVKNRDLSSAELLDPKTGQWVETGEMTTVRNFHLAVLLPSGEVLVAGGSDGKGDDLSSAELYNPTTGKWTTTGSMHSPHPNERASLQANGKVLVYSGGWNPGIPIYGHELYDPVTGTWSLMTNK